MNKVYCKYCKYCMRINSLGGMLPSEWMCSCQYILENNPYSTPDGIKNKFTRGDTKILNKNNDCKYYKFSVIQWIGVQFEF